MPFITVEVIKGNYSVTPDATVGPSQEREQVGRSCLLKRRLDRALGSIWPVRLGGGICSSQFLLPPFNVLISSDYVLAGGDQRMCSISQGFIKLTGQLALVVNIRI